jgi:hypothetical protein
MMCTVVRPGNDEFDVRCYAEEFLKVMDSSRELLRETPDTLVAEQRLDEEIKSGSLRLPDHPTASYRMLGPIKAYDPRTNSVTADIEKWQSIHFSRQIFFISAGSMKLHGLSVTARGAA